MCADTPGPRKTTFHVVHRAAPRPPLVSGRVWVVLLLAIAAVGVVGASGFAVNQRADTSSIYAERFSIGDDFELTGSTIWVANAARAASGVQGSPVELAAAGGAAHPALVPDQWVYSVTLSEATPGAVGGGNFTADLFVDEVSVGRVFLSQDAPDAAAVESVRLSFPVGVNLAPSSLYYVVVKPFVQTGPTVAYTLQSTPAGGNTWTGQGAGIDGLVNPALTAPVGATLRLTAVSGDGVTHDIGIKDASGALVSPPGWSADIEAVGSTATLSWAPTVAGSYTYLCKYHAATMNGTLTVA